MCNPGSHLANCCQLCCLNQSTLRHALCNDALLEFLACSLQLIHRCLQFLILPCTGHNA